MTAAESLLMQSHANLCAASRALDAAVTNFRIESTDANLASVVEAGRIYASAQMESSGNFCDAVQGLPLGTTNARLDALEAKHTPRLALVTTSGVWVGET